MPDLISEEYLQQITLLHATTTWGVSGYSHIPEILKYKKQLKAKTILDFGCGRGTLKTELLKLNPFFKVSEYDPAIPGKDQLPQPADLLVCNDVLEHIELELLEKTLSYLRSLTLKGAYFTIDLAESKVWLPDGRNAHLIIQPMAWWINRFKKEFRIVKFVKRKGLCLWVR